MKEQKLAKPLFKWAGGKRRIARVLGKGISDLLANRSGRYFEPFLGGGAVALALGTLGMRQMVLSDIEPPLMAAYEVLRDEPEEVANSLGRLIARGTDDKTYLSVRRCREEDPVANAARLIFLNRLCFNGLYRTNQQGEFNVSYGGNARPYFPSHEHFHKVALALRDASLLCADFEQIIDQATAGDVIFADPPYYSPKRAFCYYHRHPFTHADHARLAATLLRAFAKGAAVFTTNADHVAVRSLYAWATCENASESRTISSTGSHRNPVACVLFRAVPDFDGVVSSPR